MDSDSSDDDNGYCNCLSNVIGIPGSFLRYRYAFLHPKIDGLSNC